MSEFKAIKTEELTKIANAIRYKTGKSDKINLEAMAKEIREIEGGVSLPELENEGSASDLLSGKELIDSDGNVVTGTIATKTSSDLTASDSTVTVPAGYYASQATKSVATATRAETTMTTTADDTNDKLTITASNNQTTGYVTGADKTATKTVTLTASGATVTASDGSKSISKSVDTATQATPSVSVNSSGLITATATQTAGYVSAGTKSGTKQLTTQAAKTITPSKSSQTAVAKDVYTTGVITVAAIPDNYITTTDATATSSDILSGKTAYVDGEKVTGTIATKTSSNLTVSGATVTVPSGYYAAQATKNVATATQATPSVSVNSSGLITATATQTAGYVAAGSKSGTKQLTTQSAKTITPSKSSQTAVAKDVYTTGAVTVAAIPSQYITTTDATASADEIMSGETAYVNGSKVTGTFTIDTELSAQDNLISQIQTALQNKASATGEDVTSETNAYTTKLATLETAITALETELQGKASGGGGANIETSTVTFYTELSGIYVYATIVNADGSLGFTHTDLRSGEETVYTILKNSIVCIVSDSWEANFYNNTNTSGFEYINMMLQDGALFIQPIADTAYMSFTGY